MADTMRAVALAGPGVLEIREVPVPLPGPTQVRVRVAGAGLCHSDLHLLGLGPEWPFFGTTMGHETAGHVDAVGSAVTGFGPGDPVLVGSIWACGRCRACNAGRQNVCTVAGSREAAPLTPGVTVDGGMADFMIAEERHLVPLDGVDPVGAGPLADAGLTPMHAIETTRDRLDPGSTVVVIGIGGLGHMGLQILAATSAARVVAVDPDPRRRELALRLGATEALDPGSGTAARILDLTGGDGVDAVFDFVGVQQTVDLAAATVAAGGGIRFIGLGGGRLDHAADLDATHLPWGVDVARHYGGTWQEQREVVSLARSGRLRVETVEFALDDALEAFDALKAGGIVGRAVLVP